MSLSVCKMNFLRERSTNHTMSRFQKTWTHLWCRSLDLDVLILALCSVQIGPWLYWEPALILLHWFPPSNSAEVLSANLISFIGFGWLPLGLSLVLRAKIVGLLIIWISSLIFAFLATPPCRSMLVKCDGNWHAH